MRAASAAIFLAGIGFVASVSVAGAQYGVVEVVILTFLLALAGLGLTMLFRSKGVAPATCPSCGGVISPNAPFCKHCRTEL